MKKKFNHKSLSYYRKKAEKVQEEALNITLQTLVSMSTVVDKARGTISKDITYEKVWCAILTTLFLTEEGLSHNGDVLEGNFHNEKGDLVMSYYVDRANKDWEVYVVSHMLVGVYGYLLIDNGFVENERGN